MKGKLILFILTILLSAPGNSAEGNINITDPPDCFQANEACLHCHGEEIYQIFSTDSSQSTFRTMLGRTLIPRELYYNPGAVHRSFLCVDCHSTDFEQFPHPVDARFEYMYECLDCHGGDEAYAKYHFENIAVEYDSSIHASIEGDRFSCWSCHNPHSYVVHARNQKDISKIVAFDNNVCLSCHTNRNIFHLLSDKEPFDLIANHDWLPNQELHFRMVRCIDCHAKETDSVMVAHAIYGRERALHKCENCHATNTHLSNTLYKFMSRKERRENGFLNAVIINESYMIGTNRNLILNWISAILFLLVVIGIAFHAIKRVLKSN